MLATANLRSCSLAELTRIHFGESLTLDQVRRRLATLEPEEPSEAGMRERLPVGSVGYEKHRDNRVFAHKLRAAGVKRVIDVRQLPISRRRGYAKQALAQAMDEADIEYVHIKALGNPKQFRDLYKSGQVDAGRRGYHRYLLDEQVDALRSLVPLLSDKRSALLCVEHDPAVCHRAVILEALQDELGIDLDVFQVV